MKEQNRVTINPLQTLQPSLIVAGNEKVYFSGAPFRLLALTTKNRLGFEILQGTDTTVYGPKAPVSKIKVFSR
jgi:hypothetical protein